MNANNSPESKGPAAADWHPADVLAALKKRGHSLAGLSVANGYHPTAAGKALKQPWPAIAASYRGCDRRGTPGNLAQPV